MDWDLAVQKHFEGKKFSLSKLNEMLHQEEVKATANTLFADINEIWMAFVLAGRDWSNIKNGQEAKKAYDDRIKSLLATNNRDDIKQKIKDQKGRAEVMASEVLSWADQNSFGDYDVSEVWWTARPGILGQAVGADVDWRKNPTDVLIKFGDGEFLGVSAKSTRGKGEIGFKNPGLGSLSGELGIDLYQFVEESIVTTLKKLGVDGTAKQRKAFIRANPNIQSQTRAVGEQVLQDLRDMLFQVYVQMSNEDLRKHIIDFWLDAGDNYPFYVKVTGHGKNDNYSATVVDVINNDKMKALSSKDLELQLEVEGFTDAIGIIAGDQKIMKMRFKFESEKLASSIKLSGDPW